MLCPDLKVFICAAFLDVLTLFSIRSLSSFRELYPGLAKSLQSVHGVLDSSSPLLPLQLQRVQALLSLLTQVTNTAGCHQELQTSMLRYRSGLSLFIHNLKKKIKPGFLSICMLSLSSQGEECPPPPPVSWGHVTGLQPSLLGHLKGFVKNLDNPLVRETCLLVIPAYLVYLHAYYHQLFRQVPVSALYCETGEVLLI